MKTDFSSWSYHRVYITVKPVYNDHLYDKICYLRFIQ